LDGIRIFDRHHRAGKRYRDGTHRARLPRTTLARARRLMPRLGITRLANLTGLDCLGIPVFAAIRPNGRSLSTSQGKGLSVEAAAASALMESIETWHAENVTLPRVRGSIRGLRGRLPLADAKALPREPGRKLDLDARFDWVRGWDLLAGAPAWVPLEAVTLDCVFRPGYAPTFALGSNGLASGNHLLEAIVHGLCEVIERDAEARWRLARGQRRVELATVGDAHGRALLDRLAAARVRTTVWDITSDVGVPAYGCAIMEDPREPAWRALGLYQGFGCHLDAPVALARAVSEAVQTRVSYISGSRDDFFPHDYARTTDEPLLLQIWDELDEPPEERVDFAAAPRLAKATFQDDLQTLLRLLQAAGARQVLVVDLSRPDLQVPVVKVLVPGRATRLDLMG
jgi:YcaO-like protein with predicted kinase domain